jgi:hypothetical protein
MPVDYKLRNMPQPELERRDHELYAQLCVMSDTYNRHGWAGGKEDYEKTRAEVRAEWQAVEPCGKKTGTSWTILPVNR